MQPKLLWFLIASLAAYRCASIVTAESGPFDIFEKLREHAPPWLAKGLRCFACTSVWFGFLFAILVASNVKEWLILSFAISAVAVLVYMLDILISKNV